MDITALKVLDPSSSKTHVNLLCLTSAINNKLHMYILNRELSSLHAFSIRVLVFHFVVALELLSNQ